MTKDWMTAAAEEILTEDNGTGTTGFILSVDAVRGAIAKHCPFKEDVAYVEFRPHEWRQGRWTDTVTGEESDAPYRVCKNCLVRSDCAPSETCTNGGITRSMAVYEKPLNWDEGHITSWNGVARIPVPRCETCAHWTHRGIRSYCGCTDLRLRASLVFVPPLETTADFGCVQWSAKRCPFVFPILINNVEHRCSLSEGHVGNHEWKGSR